MSIAWTPALYPRSIGATGEDLSLEEWAALDEDVEGELVGHRLVEEEVPDPIHELAVSWLIRMFGEWLQGDGFVFGSDTRLAVSADSGRKPDLVVILPGSPAPPRRGMIRVPPDILVEVVTPTPRDERRDRVQKLAEYASLGVSWYWIVDPALGTVEVFERDASGRYLVAAAITSGTMDPVPGWPGRIFDADALWNELERLAPEE